MTMINEDRRYESDTLDLQTQRPSVMETPLVEKPAVEPTDMRYVDAYVTASTFLLRNYTLSHLHTFTLQHFS